MNPTAGIPIRRNGLSMPLMPRIQQYRLMQKNGISAAFTIMVTRVLGSSFLMPPTMARINEVIPSTMEIPSSMKITGKLKSKVFRLFINPIMGTNTIICIA